VPAALHLLFAEETAAQEGSKIVLLMLATGVIFLLVIALGELTHMRAKRRRELD
jgi:heme/copper-type cytochrome/quinol oxidase subunit 2